MNKFMNINPGRFAAILSIFLITLALSACGGGGGSDSGGGTTPASGQVSASACTVSDGASACNIRVSWSTSDASSPRVTVGGATVSTLASGSGSFSISLGTTTVALSDGSTILGSVNVPAVCATNSTLVSGVCRETTPVYNYAELTLAVEYLVPKRVLYVEETGTTPLINNTGFAEIPGGNVIGGCAIGSVTLTNGQPLAECQVAIPGTPWTFPRKIFPINPATKALDPEYTGTLPDGLVFRDVPYGTIGTGPYTAQGIGFPYGMHTDTSSGTYYYKDDRVLMFTSDSFVTSRTIGTNQVQYLTTFRNP